MPAVIKAFKPTSPARRYYEVANYKQLDGSDSLYKKLTEHQTNKAGRNNHGRITSRFRGGGHKQEHLKRDLISVASKHVNG